MSPLNALLQAVSLTSSALSSTFNNKTAKTCIHNQSDNLYYLFISRLAIVAVMFLYARTFRISGTTLFLAVLFGLDSILCGVLSILSLKNGPMSLTILISQGGALLISTILGTILFHETVKPIQIVGIAIMLCVIILLSGAKASGNIKPIWFLTVTLGAALCGMLGIIQKYQGASGLPEEKPVFLLYSFLVSTAFNGIWLLVRTRTGKKEAVTVPVTAFFYRAAVITGIAGAVNNIINLKLAIEVPSAVFFPINAGGDIILASLISSLYFREKLSAKQKVSFVLGFIAIFLIADVF